MSNEITHNPGQFDEVIHIIDNARSRAMKAVNAELIQMYWEIGAYVSGRVKDEGWGKHVVADFSKFLQAHYPGTKGFSTQNIWRMKQFYETYPEFPGVFSNHITPSHSMIWGVPSLASNLVSSLPVQLEHRC